MNGECGGKRDKKGDVEFLEHSESRELESRIWRRKLFEKNMITQFHTALKQPKK